MLKMKPFLRSVLCTRSLRTALALHTRRLSDSEIRLPGYSGSLRFRTGTSDAESLRALAQGDEIVEYRIPIECSPGAILDIGANVGVVSMIFARKYPKANIFAFEPLPENFRLLRYNVAPTSGRFHSGSPARQPRKPISGRKTPGISAGVGFTTTAVSSAEPPPCRSCPCRTR